MANEVMNELATWAVGLPSVGVLIAYGISIIRRRASADSKALHEDKSYNDMLENYKSERDEMRAERDRIIARMTATELERNEAVRGVGKLTAEVEFLTTRNTELKALVDKLSNSLELARIEIHTFAIENAKLAAHVSYLNELIERKKELANSQPNP